MKKIDPKVHWEPVQVNNGADTYCMKDDTRVEGPWEFGTRPVKRNSKTDWQLVKEQSIAGKFEEIDPSVLIQHYGNIRRIHTDLGPQVDPVRTEQRQALWYWGTTGTGKSRKAYQDNPGAYDKECNKWWPNYRDQKVVIMDELQPEVAKCLVGHLKKWADPWYNHGGEIKGSNVNLRHDLFIVTS